MVIYCQNTQEEGEHMPLLRKKDPSDRILSLPLDAIRPNPDQPRRFFDQEGLEELADSIRALGILQPLTVRQVSDGWELVAGERRLRAAALAGLDRVPCISIQTDSQSSSLLALVDNLQRRDLDFLEEALALVANEDPEKVWVIGGGEIYKAMLPYCSKCYMTKVYAQPECDVFFPDLDEMESWQVMCSEPAARDGELEYQFVDYISKT